MRWFYKKQDDKEKVGYDDFGNGGRNSIEREDEGVCNIYHQNGMGGVCFSITDVLIIIIIIVMVIIIALPLVVLLILLDTPPPAPSEYNLEAEVNPDEG